MVHRQSEWITRRTQTYHTVYTEIYSIEKVFKTKIREKNNNNNTAQNTLDQKLNERWSRNN